MKIFNFISLFILLILSSFDIVNSAMVQRDNNVPAGFYGDMTHIRWEETAMLKLDGPCKVNKIHIYFSGSQAKTDSIWIMGDPAEGAYPPSQFVRSYCKTTEPVKYQYSGTPGWIIIDVSDKDIHSDGLDRIVVQHDIIKDGPCFTYDSDGWSSPLSSFLCDALTPNPDFYNIQGTLFYRPTGDFMVRLEVDYDFPSSNTSMPPPVATLVDITKEAGLVDASNALIPSALASVADFNNDGIDDVAIGSMFFKNNGNGTFENVSSKININAGGTIWGDYNNDGYLDCFAANGWGSDQMFKGKADGTFEETTDGNIVLDAPTVTPLWLDYNHDGNLDLFIAYGRKEVNGVETYYPDVLFKSKGDGTFQDVRQSSKIYLGEPSPYYDTWAASVCDYNNDNYPDIFVATYRLAPDRLYSNKKDGNFDEVSSQTGVIGVPTNAQGYYGHGMGSDWGDFNNDGYVDLAVGNLGHPDGRGASSNPSLIFKNNGPNNISFTENHWQMGLKFFEMNAGINWLDLDLDGYIDLFHCQYSYDNIATKNIAIRDSRVYINQGPDKNFKLKDMTWQFGSLIHGAWSPVSFDYDNDGDLDLLIASSNENVKLFRNDLQRRGNWISFRLAGSPANKVNMDAYGSNVTVYAGGKQFFRSLPGSIVTARASQSTSELLIGIGNNNTIDSVVAVFTDGKKVVLTDLQTNRKYRLNYNGTASALKVATPALSFPPNKSDISSQPQYLKWYKCGGATAYLVAASYDKDFSTLLANEEVTTSNQMQIKFNLDSGKTVYWKVKSIADSDTSAWSSVWTFSKNKATSVEENNPNKMNVAIAPNPFENSSYISFTLEKESNVEINISDNNGKLIGVLVSKTLQVGNYSFAFDGDNLASGVYFCTIKAGEFSETKKIVLKK